MYVIDHQGVRHFVLSYHRHGHEVRVQTHAHLFRLTCDDGPAAEHMLAQLDRHVTCASGGLPPFLLGYVPK